MEGVRYNKNDIRENLKTISTDCVKQESSISQAPTPTPTPIPTSSPTTSPNCTTKLPDLFTDESELFGQIKGLARSVKTWEYYDTSVVYMAFIGQIDDEYIFKYGQTIDLEKRILSHRKTYDDFIIVHIEKNPHNIQLEGKFGQDLKGLSLYRKVKMNDVNMAEHFTISPVYDIEVLVKRLQALSKCIKNNPDNGKKDITITIV